MQTVPYPCFQQVSGVIHVGANAGQERERYAALGLRVVWIEPNPPVFAQLAANIRAYGNQRAIQALVTDVDDAEYAFHVANNNGASSSIFELKQHKDIWPSVTFTTTLHIKSATLATLLDRERIDVKDYQALVLDTQGSELLVLRGSLPVLANFRFIKIEVADFEAYAGCCQLADVDSFMATHGYEEVSRKAFATRAGGGTYYDIIYELRRHGSGIRG